MKRFDKGYLVVLLVCFLAVWPFLKYVSLPHDTDAELHVFRLAELQRMMSGGVIYPRWAANFYYGYGYPIFNYYAPLTYYVGAALGILNGFDAVASVKLVFILGILCAGIGMYGFFKETWGKKAGLVAAAAYVYAPYIVYIDPHARGVLAESFSFGVLPLAFWSLTRLSRKPSPLNFLASVLSLGAVILSHNLMAMVFGALLFSWFVWTQAIVILGSQRALVGAFRRYSLLGFIAFGLGVGLVAFFWMPMVLEQDAVNISTVVGEGSHYDFRNHFVSLGELFGRINRLDWGATETDYNFNFGIMQWGLALVGIIMLVDGKTRERTHGFFFVFSWVVLIFLMLPISVSLWEVLPLLPFLQFPWRLLGAAAAVIAVLGGIGIGRICEAFPRLANVVVIGVIGLIILSALPLTQLAAWQPFGPTSAFAALESELAGRWLGTTSTADFVPATVVNQPREENQVLQDFFQDQPIERLNRATLGEADVVTTIVSPVHTRYAVTAPNDMVLRLFLFDFPGWKATVNGEEVEKVLALPEGFITIPLEAGQHEVEVKFGTTPARTGGWVLTTISLIMSVAVAWEVRRRVPKQARPEVAHPPQNSLDSLLASSMATLIIFTLAFIEPRGWMRDYSADYVAIPAQTDTFVSFNSEIALIGYDTPERVIESGEAIDLTLYWQAEQQVPDNYQVFVHLLNAEGAVAAQSDKLNPGDFPTEDWPTNRYVRDEHRLTLPADLPQGTYQLTTGLYSLVDGTRLVTVEPAGEWFVLEELIAVDRTP